MAEVPEAEPIVVLEAEPTVVPEAEPAVVPEAEPAVVPEAEPAVAPEAEPAVIPEAEPDESGQFSRRLAEFASCIICKARLQNPHLCPICSTLFCFKCISDRLKSGYQEYMKCPRCRVVLELDKIVEVRWFENIEGLIRECMPPLPPKGGYGKKGECSKHSQLLSLFCDSCELCICTLCVFSDSGDSDHVEHSFRNLDMVYKSNKEVLKAKFEMMKINQRKIDLLLKKLKRNEELIKEIKEEKLKEIKRINECMIQSIERQAIEKLEKIEQHRTKLKQDMTVIEQTFYTVETEVRQSTETQFMVNKARLYSTCDDIITRPISAFKDLVESGNFEIEFPNINISGAFIVENFSQQGDATKIVYSKEINDGLSNVWRIMVWLREAHDEMGVYLQFVHGSPCWVECDFILHHSDPEKIVRGTKKQYFEGGKDRFEGINDFISRTKLSEDKYVRDDDSLSIMYHIRRCPPDWE